MLRLCTSGRKARIGNIRELFDAVADFLGLPIGGQALEALEGWWREEEFDYFIIDDIE